jgi:hypothetical protein
MGVASPILRGLFLNSSPANCSIYESGKMAYSCLALSTRYQMDYREISQDDQQLGKYDFYVFNYHHATMKWLNTERVSDLPGLKATLVLETLPNDPFVLCPSNHFDVYCALDPTMDHPDKRVYAFPRPLEVVSPLPAFRQESVPVIGSFGFATPGKGFELVVDAVNREFEEAVVRINIPPATFADPVTRKLHGCDYAQYLMELCRQVAKNGIEVVFSTNYMSKKQLIYWCAQNTLNCFLYNRMQPGLSATTDQAISSGRPLIISANETFRHIHPYITPYPQQSLKDAIVSSDQGVRSMQEDWSPSKFADRFEEILEDHGMLSTLSHSQTLRRATSSARQKVLIVTHAAEQCGIAQYGINIANALNKSNKFNFVLSRCSSINEFDTAFNKEKPCAIIFNYYPYTMPWLVPTVTAGCGVPTFGIMHEVTQQDADRATPELFNYHLCPDPTLVENNAIVFRVKRLIPPYINMKPLPSLPTIGSFGFGFGNKGFENLVHRVQEEFDQAVIVLHLPFNDVVDPDGKTHCLRTADACQKAVRKSGIKLAVNHRFLPPKALLDILAAMSINVFLYDLDRQRGISSVIDYALAVQRPIAISRSGMFRHMKSATPSIFIEDSSLKHIMRNGIAPLVPYYNEWSESNFVKGYERVLAKVLKLDWPSDGEAHLSPDGREASSCRKLTEEMTGNRQAVWSMHPESACQGDAAKPTRGASVRGCQRPDRKAVDLKGSRPVIRKISNVQIELSGRCSAECEFCDWVRRPKEQMIFMDTEVAKKCVREARTLGAKQISFHITGESLLHPKLLEILPRDYPILVSTNCLQLNASLARELANMENLTIILAVLWCESERKRIASIVNASSFLQMNPRNRLIILQMICSQNSVPWVPFMYHYFSPFLGKLPQLQLHYKQPYMQEPERPTLGYIPTGISESPRIQIDRMPTPQSCGPDCVAFSPNPSTDILIQSDGQIKPCFKRWPHWDLGYAQTTSLSDAWESKRFAEIRSIWSKGDPHNQLACHDCIRMGVPRGKAVWWGPGGTGIPPSALNQDQSMRSNDPNPYPKL